MNIEGVLAKDDDSNQPKLPNNDKNGSDNDS